MNIEISPKEYERKLDWYGGMLYCQLLLIDGTDDWILPTKEELDYIYHSKNDCVGSLYWSATEGNGSNAWLQGLSSGLRGSYNLKRNSYYVRPVRSLTI